MLAKESNRQRGGLKFPRPGEKAVLPSPTGAETPFFEDATSEAAWGIGPGNDKAGQVIRWRTPRRRQRLENMTPT